MGKSNVLGRRNRPHYDSYCHIEKYMDKKNHLLVRILEAIIENQIDGNYYTDISTYDIQYFMTKEGFKNVEYSDIFKMLKFLESFSIINCQYLTVLDTGEEIYEVIHTPENETFYIPKKKRRIWLKNSAFYKIDQHVLELTPKEERTKLITNWVKHHQKIRYRITPSFKQEEYVKIPIRLITDNELENDAFRYFCALMYVSKFNRKKDRNEVAKSIGIDSREGMRLLEELGKNSWLTVEPYFKDEKKIG